MPSGSRPRGRPSRQQLSGPDGLMVAGPSPTHIPAGPRSLRKTRPRPELISFTASLTQSKRGHRSPRPSEPSRGDTLQGCQQPHSAGPSHTQAAPLCLALSTWWVSPYGDGRFHGYVTGGQTTGCQTPFYTIQSRTVKQKNRNKVESGKEGNAQTCRLPTNCGDGFQVIINARKVKIFLLDVDSITILSW